MTHLRRTIPISLTLLGALAAFGLSRPSRAAKPGEWEYVTTDKNVVVYRKEIEGSDIVAFRGVTYADIPIGKLFAVFRDETQRKYWVDRYEEHTTFEKTPNSETYWIHFGLPWPVSDRDYVLQAVSKSDPENRRITVNIKSVESPKKGEDDCCVRATVHGTYYEFTALPGEQKTKLIVEVHTDPKGSIPTWLVNLIQKSWPSKTLRGLIDHASRSTAQPLAEYADWHEKRSAGPVTSAPEPAPGASVGEASSVH